MKKIFIDTDVLVALNDSSDLLHEKALQNLNKLIGFDYHPFLSTNIILEAATIISQKVGKKNAINLLREIRSGKYTIINPDEETVLDAEKIFTSIKSKNVSYSDCLSFTVMKKNQIDWALSFDVHFKKQGFKRFGLDR